MGNYKLTTEAKDDIIRIHQFGIKTFGVHQADRYFNELYDCFEIISDQPYLYQVSDQLQGQYRRSVYNSDTIYFVIEEDFIEIVRIVGMQDI